jgi:hypothetical protein
MSSKRTAWNKWTLDKFIEKSQLKHGDNFDYSKVIYVNSQTKVIIICKTCNTEFLQQANSHIQGYGCDKCAHIKNHKDQTFNKDIFIKKAQEVHGDKFDYSISEYKLSRIKLDIKCNKCLNVFSQTPNNHISKRFGCPHCAGNAILTTEKFIGFARKIHGDKYDYIITNYIRSSKNVKIRCIAKNIIFEQTPNNHLSGYGCLCCSPKHSKPSTRYMKYLSVSNPDIEYALNPKEHRVKNSRYHADGYIPSKNLIVEFQGCFYHGCPKCYNPNEICGVTKKTHISAFKQTLIKKQHILDQGYLYREVWGCQWERAEKAIRILQKSWKIKHF